jgi:hypothetical protein
MERRMSEPREFWIERYNGNGKLTALDSRPEKLDLCKIRINDSDPIAAYNYFHLIEKSAYDALKAENEELKFRLIDRSEKYKIAIDKGIYEWGLKVKAHEAALKVARLALEFYENKSYVSGPDEFFKDTKFNAGRDTRFPNRVGRYGTTSSEAIKEIDKLLAL